MRPLRWKSRYATGDEVTDRGYKQFVSCLNQLMEAADRREHCQEMEQFMSRLSADAEACLRMGGESARAVITEFYRRFAGALPLTAHTTTACRQCGLCDVAEARIAPHLEASLACLNALDI